MTTILDAVGTYIDANDSLTAGTNLFGARMQETPDVAVCLYEYAGEGPGYAFGASGQVIDRPRIQLVSRASRDDYATARDKAVTLRALLDVAGVTMSGITVLRITPIASVFSMGPDEQDRPLVGCNFTCEIIR